MNQIKNITKNAINILCVILFIVLALVIYAKLKITFSDDIHANYFGYRILEVASGSMEPTLKINDVLLVKVNEDDLKENDIIAYMQGDAIITHRIVLIDNDNILVKGDANNAVDAPIVKDQVIGKITKVFPKLGVWKKILTEPKILILIFITLLLFDAALSYDNKKEKKVKKEEISKLEISNIEEAKDDEKAKQMLEQAKKLALSQMDLLINDNNQDKEDSEYTVRLDLNEIQKNINKNVK